MLPFFLNGYELSSDPSPIARQSCPEGYQDGSCEISSGLCPPGPQPEDRLYKNPPFVLPFQWPFRYPRSLRQCSWYMLRQVGDTIRVCLKLFCLNQLGIPQDRMAKRLSVPQRTLCDHLAEMLTLAFPLNSDLSKGFTALQVA